MSPVGFERSAGDEGDEGDNMQWTNYEEPSTAKMKDRFESIGFQIVNLLPSDLRHCIAAGCNILWGCDPEKGYGVKVSNPVIIVQHDDGVPGSCQIYVHEAMPGGGVRSSKFRYSGVQQ